MQTHQAAGVGQHTSSGTRRVGGAAPPTSLFLGILPKTPNRRGGHCHPLVTHAKESLKVAKDGSAEDHRATAEANGLSRQR